jgi:hypothetical protein
VTGNDFTATVAAFFQCCRPFETQRGNHSWSRLEPLPALHETIQTSDHISASTPYAARTISTVSVAVLPALKQTLSPLIPYLTPQQYGFAAQH